MAATIEVAIRCRTFTHDDKLGVKMHQISEDEAEVQVINIDNTTTRFNINYAWWSAFGFKRRMTGEDAEVDAIPLIDQNGIYQQCGLKIKDDLLAGRPVVLMNYGLTGSGNILTLFGPDNPEAPECWYKFKEEHSLWVSHSFVFTHHNQC